EFRRVLFRSSSRPTDGSRFMSATLGQPTPPARAKATLDLPPVHWTERYFRLLWGTVGIVGCLVAWQLGSSTGVLDPLFVSSPLEVMRTASRLLPSPEFLGHLSVTAQCLFLGLFGALVAGVLVGLPIGWFPRLHATFEPVIAAV